MSEPPEQEEEEPEDPAAGADLGDLLEQFREPEEPRRQRANPLWFVSAILLTVVACWLALRASGREAAKDKPKSVALAGAMLPGKTSERLLREGQPVNVVKDYLARCKKGMTEQEVRWIVEDFQKAGLDHPPEGERIEKFVAARLQQHRWYLDLLADGLGLDAEQRRVASEKLWLLADEATQVAAKAVMEHDSRPEKSLEMEPEILQDLIDANRWLEDERYAPWEVCSLILEQEAVTRRSEFEKEGLQQKEVQADREDSSAMMWLDQGTPFRSSLMRDIHLADGDFGDLAAAGNIFPLEESQLFEGEEFLRINDPTRLHPAQLKMLLLLEPQRAAEILKALEKAGE